MVLSGGMLNSVCGLLIEKTSKSGRSLITDFSGGIEKGLEPLLSISGNMESSNWCLVDGCTGFLKILVGIVIATAFFFLKIIMVEFKKKKFLYHIYCVILFLIVNQFIIIKLLLMFLHDRSDNYCYNNNCYYSSHCTSCNLYEFGFCKR